MGTVVTVTTALTFVVRVASFVLGTYLAYEVGSVGIRTIKERKDKKKTNPEN